MPQTAEAWFARMNSGVPVSARDSDAFDAWVSADPTHAEAYHACQRAWIVSGLSADAPEILARRARALRQTSVNNSRRRLVWGSLGAAAAAGFAAAGFYWAGRAEVYETAPGQRLTMRLADGSEMILAPSSHIKVRLGDQKRALSLTKGQGLFTVAHDRNRPFELSTPDRQVQATGTQFQVTLAPEGTEVILLEGRVEVGSHSTPQPLSLYPGQKLTADMKIADLQPGDMEGATAWREGRLVFSAQPLRVVVMAFNRYSADRLVLADDVPGDMLISGAFQYDNVRDFALALESTFGLSVVSSGERTWAIRNG